MAASKREHGSHVYKCACLFFNRVFERLWRKSRNAWKIPEDFRAFRIYSFHERIITRDRRRGFDCVISEAFRVGELQKLIEFPLVPDGAAQSRANVGAARRAGAVVRINHDMIWQVKIKIVERVKLLFRELPGVFLAQQVGSARGRNEK